MSTDLERDLREVLAEKHATARTSPIAPPEILRRSRRREVRTVLLTGLAALVLIVGVIGGIQALLDREPRQAIGGDGSSTPLPTEGPNPQETSLLLASGENDGQGWTLRVTNDPRAGGLGLSFGYEGLGGGGGGIEPMKGERLFQGYGGSSSPTYPDNDTTRPPLPREIAGQVTVDAARVEYQLERGPTLQATVYPLPEELIGPAKVFLLFVPGDTLLVAGDLIAYDGSGAEIGREYLDMSPVSLYPKVIEESPPEAVAAMKDLQLAGAVVGRYFDLNGSFSRLDPSTASAISSDVVYNTSATAVPGEVSLRVNGPQDLVLATATSTGDVYSACLAGGPYASTYGRNDTSDAYACTNGWLDPSAPAPESTSSRLASGSAPDGTLWSLRLVPTGRDVELGFIFGTLETYLPLRPLGESALGSVVAVDPSRTPVGRPPVPGLPTPVYGLASDLVARVELRTHGGETFEGTLYPVPAGSIDAEQVFMILVPVDGQLTGTVVAFDAAGDELQREPVTSDAGAG